MLRFLLDEHISPDVTIGLRRRNRTLIVHSLIGWENGKLLGQEDSACLLAAADHGLTFVTYDRRTIPLLLKSWAEEGRHYGGVIFVDEKTISPANIGGLVRALDELVNVAGSWIWRDRIVFLQSGI